MLTHDLNRSILKDPEHCVINEREDLHILPKSWILKDFKLCIG